MLSRCVPADDCTDLPRRTVDRFLHLSVDAARRDNLTRSVWVMGSVQKMVWIKGS